MLIQILAFLLDIVTGLIGGACLLRLFMQHQRVSFANPLGRLVFALSDWLVLPLRRILPSVGRWDTASLVGVWLLKLGQVVGLGWLAPGSGFGAAATWPLLAALGVAQLLVSGLTALLIAHAVLTWVQPHSTLADVLGRLSKPLLRPMQRWIPLVGGVDLSPLVVLVGLQIAGMLLAGLARHVLL